MDKIDNLDKKILNIIMQNARIPSKDVAVQCGVSRAAIHQRIQRLIDMKVITGSDLHRKSQISRIQHMHLCGCATGERFDVSRSG